MPKSTTLSPKNGGKLSTFLDFAPNVVTPTRNPDPLRPEKCGRGTAVEGEPAPGAIPCPLAQLAAPSRWRPHLRPDAARGSAEPSSRTPGVPPAGRHSRPSAATADAPSALAPAPAPEVTSTLPCGSPPPCDASEALRGFWGHPRPPWGHRHPPPPQAAPEEPGGEVALTLPAPVSRCGLPWGGLVWVPPVCQRLAALELPHDAAVRRDVLPSGLTTGRPKGLTE